MIKLSTFALAVAVSLGLGAGAAFADPDRENVSVKFRYDRSDSAAENYGAFRSQARHACGTPGLKLLAQVLREKACVNDLMDKFVATMGRADLASVHAARTGRSIGAMRDLAAR